jgi:hypothetical protein
VFLTHAVGPVQVIDQRSKVAAKRKTSLRLSGIDRTIGIDVGRIVDFDALEFEAPLISVFELLIIVRFRALELVIDRWDIFHHIGFRWLVFLREDGLHREHEQNREPR